MNPLTGTVSLTFIRGGISGKSGKPYLQLSNGRKEFFALIDKSFFVDNETFSDISENDLVDFEVQVVPGNDTVRVMGFALE